MESLKKLRVMLWVAMAVIVFSTVNTYSMQNKKNTPEVNKNLTKNDTSSKHSSIPNEISDILPEKPKSTLNKVESGLEIPESRIIRVSNEIFEIQIDKLGGDIIFLGLNKYPREIDSKEGFVLFDHSKERFYIAQSGLINDNGPDSTTSGRTTYEMPLNAQISNDKEYTYVTLLANLKNGVEVQKIFKINNSNYLIDIEFKVNNKSGIDYIAKPYGRLKQKSDPNFSPSMFNVSTFRGAALTTPSKPFKKLEFKDLVKSSFQEEVEGGWAAMEEHYFLSAFVPNQNELNYYQAKYLGEDLFSIGFVGPSFLTKPNDENSVSMQLYAGPEIPSNLSKIAKGLELTVDYGIFWPICAPIFWVLKNINDLVGNWGLSIILTTLMIKLLFFKLSASSYKSMARMKTLQPKLEEIKKQYGDDKQKYGEEVMKLYKREKVNPIGGCLPILIQIPVFIALYYVLVGSVDLRQAPFFGWIHDLSAKDPYYILPLIMGATMYLQQKMSPAPADPAQAQVMMFMPIIFTILFIQFPAGLVLYWTVNNLLSILQQWIITRKTP